MTTASNHQILHVTAIRKPSGLIGRTIRAVLCLTGILCATSDLRAEESSEVKELSAAVRELNDQTVARPVGALQPPLSETEVLAAIQRHVDSGDVDEQDKADLAGILDSKQLPPHVRLRHVSRYDDGEGVQHVWWIRLMCRRENGSTRTYAIREQSIFTRPYTLLEREFKKRVGDTLPVLNLLVAYFPDDPQFGRASDIPAAAAQALTDRVRKATQQRDLPALLALYMWDDVDNDVRTFAAEEMQSVLGRDIINIRVMPRRYGGELQHVQAFTTYHPNVPVIGYLVLDLGPTDDSPAPQSLWLECGLVEDTLRLAGYRNAGEKIPGGFIHCTSQAHSELTPDGSLQLSFTNDASRALIGPNLANETVWRVKKE